MNDIEVRSVSELIPISDREFRLLTDLIYQRFGINLDDQKRSLVVGRLNKVLRKLGFTNFQDYHHYLMTDKTGEAQDTLINRISTNHTFFWREHDHFELLRDKVLPEVTQFLKSTNRRDLKIWCPGCSSGEEPYMLAMLAAEHFGKELGMWDVGILATDISACVLNRATEAVYSEENVSHLPIIYKRKYMLKQPDHTWRVSDKIRKMVMFRRLNLMRDSYPFKKKFRLIFCRNVMIYFDRETREALVGRFSQYMEEDGYLFIGHSESLSRTNSYYKYVQPAVYQKQRKGELVK
ncbi:protein-glutamate O-methyltransferase CheR [bacterium]|nr:protein-glutamate O-methyltransferase CheR [bacterium]MBU1650977.1 protein-glutamate O-methyltransferase CheR [bacterium]MBU1880909.1 protein-glutamate O-methyltransferase CheR [bacterium]